MPESMQRANSSLNSPVAVDHKRNRSNQPTWTGITHMRYLSALHHAATVVLPCKSDLHHIKTLGRNLAVLFLRIIALISYPISVPLLALALVKNETPEQKQAAATLERALAQQNSFQGKH